MSVMTVHSIMRYFEYAHLPPHLQAISKPFHDLAWGLHVGLNTAVDQQEQLLALRKLLESKDCAVRATVPLKKGLSEETPEGTTSYAGLPPEAPTEEEKGGMC